jgi:HD-like signal output (HDOD) protein
MPAASAEKSTVIAKHSATQATPLGKSLPPALEQALSKISELGSLPEVTTKIVNLVEDLKSTAKDMHDVVKTDPALATKVLKVVNSSFYGLPSQIASLDRAITMLGLTAVKNIALAASMARIFKGKPAGGPQHFTPRDLWKHSISVAVCGRLIAVQAKVQPADELFVAGLVHDVGLLAETQIFESQIQEIAGACMQTPQNFCAAEEASIGADHQTFGWAMATKWKFPAGLRCAIGYHHDPTTLQPEFRKFAALVYVADTICCAQGLGFSLTAKNQELSEPMLKLAGVTEAHVKATVDALPQAVEETEKIFSI